MSTGIFDGLEPRDQEAIRARLATVKTHKGAYLFYRGDESDAVYVVESGAFQIIIDNDANREIIVYTIGPGDIIGEMTLFTHAPRTATVVALADAVLYKISNSRFVELIHDYPAIGVNLSRALIERLVSANEMIERLGAMDGAERVADFLKALMAREGRRVGDEFVMDNRPTYYQISHRLGVSEKTIYRTVRDLAADGVVRVKGRKFFMSVSFMEAGSGRP
ncbi:MAG: Crp/Fnr family transcriptional regulator [Nitrospinae bacterium]|nr:Crp/Fnr family transcriptional regulator [Nitrospinota bacterium]